MTESELSFFELLAKFDDPESPDRSDRVVNLAPYVYGDEEYDDDDEEIFTPDEKMFGIYYKYLTPAERKKYAAILGDPSCSIFICYRLTVIDATITSRHGDAECISRPPNDPTREIKILRKMLLDTFALVPTGPNDKKHPLTPKFQHELFTTLFRVGFVLAHLIAWYMKLNYSKNRTADLIWEALGKIDPRATDE